MAIKEESQGIQFASCHTPISIYDIGYDRLGDEMKLLVIHLDYTWYIQYRHFHHQPHSFPVNTLIRYI